MGLMSKRYMDLIHNSGRAWYQLVNKPGFMAQAKQPPKPLVLRYDAHGNFLGVR